MKIAIMTDSGCNLTQEYINSVDNLFVVPLGITIDDKFYRDQVDISSKEVYEQIDTHTIKSSLPSIGSITAMIEEITERGYDHIFMLSISSGLSGTHNAMRLAIEDLENVTLYDTKTLSMAQGFIVRKAVELIAEGKTIEESIEILNDLRYNKSIATYTIDTLKYLRAGGRIGKVEGTIGDILKIKPIITVNDEGVYETLAKARGTRRALSKTIDYMIDRFKNKKIHLAIHYGNDLEKATMVKNRLEEQLDVVGTDLVELTPVLGIHTGPGMIAVIAFEV